MPKKKPKPKPRTRWMLDNGNGVLLRESHPTKREAQEKANQLNWAIGMNWGVVKFVEVIR